MQGNTLFENVGSFKKEPMPDSKGHFGPYGGRYVAETLIPALLEL